MLLAGSFSSCKKQLDENYLNPELTDNGSLSKLFSGMFMNKRVHPSYWDYYTFIMPTTAGYSQLTSMAPSAQMYIPNSSYTEGRWTDFYNGSTGTDYNYSGPGILNSYREMQTTAAGLSATEQELQKVYLKCAQVLVYDHAAQLVDLWGDIPFTKAGSLNTADRTVKPAAFDDAASLYDTLILGLKDLNTYFDTATLAPTASSGLAKADLLYKGDLAMWQRYTNSLRLRLLMRISNVSESKAQAEVTTMLADAATYPLIDANSQNATFKMSPTAVRSDLYDPFRDFGFAPAFLLDTLMLANNDPRTDAIFDPHYVNGYRGVPYNVTTTDYGAGKYACYDSATYMYNNNIPGVLFTASEVSFLKAEAGERWGITSAQAAYETGVYQSVAYYYGLNQSRVARDGSPKAWPALVTPSDATIATYLLGAGVAYSGTATEKLAKIYTQKWMHLGVLQAGQAWAELRRTDYPVLQFATSTNAAAATPPTRLLYPSTEVLYNGANYSAVAAKDKRDTKIFWDVK